MFSLKPTGDLRLRKWVVVGLQQGSGHEVGGHGQNGGWGRQAGFVGEGGNLDGGQRVLKRI